MASRNKATIEVDIDDDLDIPELTDESLARMRPAREAVPHIVAAYRRGELSDPKKYPPNIIRKGSELPTRSKTNVHLDDDVLSHFKDMGEGWQAAINQALRDAINKEKV